jgi:hypothetical protein
LDSIIYKLPKDVSLSRHLQENAECGAYLDVRLYGIHYYIPVTKEIKKQFGLVERHGKITYTNYKAYNRLEEISKIILDSLYLQMRDTVCGEIEGSLDQELKEGFSKLFEKYLHKRVKAEVVKKLPNQRTKDVKSIS